MSAPCGAAQWRLLRRAVRGELCLLEARSRRGDRNPDSWRHPLSTRTHDNNAHTGEKTKEYLFVRLHTDSIFPYFKRSVKHNDAALVLMHERHKLLERLHDLTPPSLGPCAREPRALRVAQVVIADLEFTARPCMPEKPGSWTSRSGVPGSTPLALSAFAVLPPKR